MLLYGNTDSGHSYKVQSFLLLTNTPHKFQWIDLSLSRDLRLAEFVSASKFGEVPVLVSEGRNFCQSNAILIYLAKHTKYFCGKDEQDWQTILEWLSWESNRIGFSVPNLRFLLRESSQPSEVLAYLHQRAIIDLIFLNKVLLDHEFLLPSGPTIADISCSAYLFWLKQAGLKIDLFDNVKRWLSSISSLPHWVHPDECQMRN